MNLWRKPVSEAGFSRVPAPSVQIAGDVVAIARSWLGTPYHHQASVRGVGCDCLGLVRGVWRELYGFEPMTPNGLRYAPDIGDAEGKETMLEAARERLAEVQVEDAAAGDVLVFRYREARIAKHAGILSSAARGIHPAMMIHAFEGTGVVEIPLSSWWRRRIAGVFRFPAGGGRLRRWRLAAGTR